MSAKLHLQTFGTEPKSKRELRAAILESLDDSSIQDQVETQGEFVLIFAAVNELPDMPLLVARNWLDKGARWVVCAGAGADQLEETFDYASFLPECGPKIPTTIMTTAHASEPLEEVLEFAFDHARAVEGARDPESVILVTLSNSIIEAAALWLESRRANGS